MSAQWIAVANAWSLCGVQGDVVENGGLEGSRSPWVVVGDASYAANGTRPHCGTGYLVMGGSDAAAGSASQTVAVPPVSPRLTSWLEGTTGGQLAL